MLAALPKDSKEKNMPNQYTKTIEPPVRFWQKVEIQDNGCWEWTGNINRKGYGGFSFNRRWVMAHRFAYELLVGPIPEGLQIDHLCRNHCCVNPAHMEPVTTQENTRRGNHRNSVKTHCSQGHPFDLFNTYFGQGHRVCRACLRERALKRYLANPEYQRARKRLYRAKRKGGKYEKDGNNGYDAGFGFTSGAGALSG